MYDLIIQNARILTCDTNFTILDNATLGIKNQLIALITTDQKTPPASQVIDARKQLLTPGLIDCHTHLIYAGNRADEFSKRLQGVTYTEIANQGGGILATVAATRAASEALLTTIAAERINVMLSHGTTTVEIKSGYGLDLDTEIKILTVAQLLAKSSPITVVSTFLGAHALPPEFKDNPDGYIDFIIDVILPTLASKKLATFVDGFCETIAFNHAQVKRLFSAAQHHGFSLKLHAEQLSDQKGALLAASFAASSVDHLEYLAPADCAKLKNGKTVAVLLPGAFYFLNEKQQPPIAALRKAHIPMAIATDANPGTSPFLTLPLIMNMACILFGLSIKEAWLGVTCHAAKALKLHHEIGRIDVGKKADLVLWSTDRFEDIVYNPSINYCKQVIKSGTLL